MTDQRDNLVQELIEVLEKVLETGKHDFLCEEHFAARQQARRVVAIAKARA